MKILRSLRQALGYVLLFLAIQYVCTLGAAVLGMSAFEAANPGGDADVFYDAFMNRYSTLILCVSQGATLLALWGLSARRRRKIGPQPAVKLGRRLAGCLFMAGVMGNMATTGIMELAPFSQQLMDSYAEASSSLDTSLLWADLLSVALLAPLVEEAIFRGAVLSRLREAMPDWLAVLLQGLVFGCIHGQLLWACYAAIFGVLLGWARVKTGSLKASVLLHLGFNLSSFFIGIVFYITPQTFGGLLAVTAAGCLLTALFLVPVARLQTPRQMPWEENDYEYDEAWR
ncbi:MAG: CPBP family intramembrane metalloprotease [Clostridiaceae bacterium]|nr:CPBP family intramembrane metalloprotease [Clostridiaceae bacterium]